uniref:Uncharacterized protein n=1 Tax=Lepeophtheirus salmonis TaxID=72036 RepID=A0A0K2VDM3_LEPSM
MRVDRRGSNLPLARTIGFVFPDLRMPLDVNMPCVPVLLHVCLPNGHLG